MAHGTGVHGKLSIYKYTQNVLSEEVLSDNEARGIADCLEDDENLPGFYVLTDYKTWGSFKVAKAIGIKTLEREEPVLTIHGDPVLLKSGPKMGLPKIKIIKERVIDPTSVDLRSEALQLNRYRIFFQRYGFPISRLQIQALVRDGGTYIAQNRGIEKNIVLVHVPLLPDEEVLSYYRKLDEEVRLALSTGVPPRLCDEWESWGGRRCEGFCEVSESCFKLYPRKGDEHGSESNGQN